MTSVQRKKQGLWYMQIQVKDITNLINDFKSYQLQLQHQVLIYSKQTKLSRKHALVDRDMPPRFLVLLSI